MHYDATFGDMLFKLLLQRYGYIGVNYPSGTNFQTSSTKEGDMNYTVFNDNDIEVNYPQTKDLWACSKTAAYG